MLRAHQLGTRHHLRSSFSSLDTPPTLAKQSLSPAAIVSLVHQHIAFRTRPWELGKIQTQKERTTLNTAHGESVYPTSAPRFVKPLGGRSTSIGLPLKYPPRIPTSTTIDLEALADDLEAYAMRKTTSSPEPLPRVYCRQSLRPRLLAILAHTQDVACAWEAYRSLLILPRSPEKPAPKVPFPHRHRLLRLLAAAPPRPLRTRGRFAQVFSIIRALHDVGGIVQKWEWNLLLDCAGKEGWRRPREEHFRAALAILAEMRARGGGDDAGGAGGTWTATTTNNGRRDGGDGAGAGAGAATSLTPDIFSYTILLAHAVRSRAPIAVRHVARLLVRAGLTPGVHAHTTLLCFFARRGDLAGVRDALFRLRRHMQDEDNDDGSNGTDSGLTQASFNAVLWAFAYNGRLDIARAMYCVVCARADIAAEGRDGEGPEGREELEELERVLAEREMIVIARDVVPDAATYHALIQAYAYQGDLRACLEILIDMLSPASSLYDDDDKQQAKEKGKGQQRQFTASLAAFRAIFLGFARHGVVSSNTNGDFTVHENEENEFQWTLPTLEALFARFLDLPRDAPLREPTLFWLVNAFTRTGGQDSSLLLRDVFERVEARFGSSALKLTRGEGDGYDDGGGGGGGSRRGRLARIRERVFSSP